MQMQILNLKDIVLQLYTICILYNIIQIIKHFIDNIKDQKLGFAHLNDSRNRTMNISIKYATFCFLYKGIIFILYFNFRLKKTENYQIIHIRNNNFGD